MLCVIFECVVIEYDWGVADFQRNQFGNTYGHNKNTFYVRAVSPLAIQRIRSNSSRFPKRIIMLDADGGNNR